MWGKILFAAALVILLAFGVSAQADTCAGLPVTYAGSTYCLNPTSPTTGTIAAGQCCEAGDCADALQPLPLCSLPTAGELTAAGYGGVGLSLVLSSCFVQPGGTTQLTIPLCRCHNAIFDITDFFVGITCEDQFPSGPPLIEQNCTDTTGTKTVDFGPSEVCTATINVSIPPGFVPPGQPALSVGVPVPILLQPTFGPSGLLQVQPNQSFSIIVPVAGSNLPTTGTTIVTLQAGSQPIQSQTIQLANIPSSGFLRVPFAVSFPPSTAGTTQTIHAAVNPTGTSPPQQNLGNNFSSVQVQVAAVDTHKLIAFVGRNATRIPDSGGGSDVVPSVGPCGIVPEQLDGATPVQIQCIDTNNPNQPVSGCQFKLHLSNGSEHAGHEHNLADGSRPVAYFSSALQSFPLDSFLPVDTLGDSLVYLPPEVSGDVNLEITGLDPNFNAILGPTYTFHVRSKDTLVNLDGAGSTKDHLGISIVTDSHPGAGTYGTGPMQTAVASLVASYYANAAAAQVSNPHELESQAATLILGGLFDANWDGGIYGPSFVTPWHPPHCGHRDGKTLDLSIKQLSPTERVWLQDAIDATDFVFSNQGESPDNPAATHWHARKP